MSVTIIPYIEEPKTVSVPSSAKADHLSASADKNHTEFREILEAEKRARAAMAVDAMIAESRSGSISGESIQQMLGFRPQAAAGAAAVSSSAKADSANDSAASNSVSGCPEELEEDFREAAATYHVDENLLKAVAKAESGFNPSATSSAGAMGIMQLMPSTAKSLGISNAYNAHDNIMGGAKVLAQNLTRYDGDISLALAGYNAGCGNVDKYGGIPPFKETQNYVKKVLNYYKAQ